MKFVKSSAIFKYVAMVIMLLMLVACGGGGGGEGTANIASLCATNAFRPIEVNTIMNKSIELDETQCFKFAAIENASYKLVVTPAFGDVDIAAHDTTALDAGSVIVYSINSLNIIDEVVFTADSSKEYFVELYGFESSEYSLELSEVNTSDYLSVSQDVVSLEGISTYSIPVTQRLIQPEIGVRQVQAIYSLGTNASPEVSFMGTATPPAWMGFDEVLTDFNSATYEYSVSSTDLPVGAYEAQAKLAHTYGTNISVFQLVNINYNVSEPPFTLSSTNRQEAILESNYDFDIIDDVQQSLIYSVEYAPNGFDVDETGHISWYPEMPMFQDVMDMNWGIRATLQDVSIILEGATQLNSTAFTQPVMRTGMPSSLLGKSMVAADWDDDGKTEIIFTDLNKVLYSVEYDSGEYIEDWVNPYALSDTQKINALSVVDLNQDGVKELIIGMWDGGMTVGPSPLAKVFVVDGTNKQIINSIDVEIEKIRSIHGGDIDDDGNVELVLYGEIDDTRIINIYEGMALTQEWASPDFNKAYVLLDEIHLGNVDDDPALEIFTGMGHVIDGLTYNIRIIKSDGFSGYSDTLAVGDADNDGIDDIVHSTTDYVYVYDGSGRVKNRFDSSQLPQTYSGRFNKVIVGDITGQGKNHIIVSVENTLNEVGFFMFNESTSTYEVDYRLNRVSAGNTVNALTIEDSDNDGSVELIFVAEGSSVGTGLVVAGYQSATDIIDVEWYKNNPTQFDVYGFFTPNYVKNSTKNNIWFISNDSYQLDGDYISDKGPRLIDLDLSTYKLSVTNPLYTPTVPGVSTRCTYITNFMTHDLNMDTVADAIVPPCRLYYPAMSIDLQNGSTILSSNLAVSFPDGSEVEAMDIGDFGDDGTQEVAIVTQLRGAYVYEMLNNQLIWDHEFEYPANGVNVFIKDLDKNGSTDLVVALKQKIVTYDYNSSDATFAQNSELLLSDIIDVKIDDMDGDGIEEVIVAHGDHYNQTISIYDNAFKAISSYHVNYSIESIHIEDLPVSRKNILVAGGEYVSYTVGGLYVNRLHAIDPFTGREVWRSPNLLGHIPKNSLDYQDINADGDIEMFFTTNKSINVIY